MQVLELHKVLFPMNAKHPCREEEDMAKTIRCVVTRSRHAGYSNKVTPAVVQFGNCFGEDYIDSQVKSIRMNVLKFLGSFV